MTISERGDMTERMRTLTAQEAVQRMEEHIARAVAALPVTLWLEEQSFDQLACDDPSDLGPRGRVSVGKRYCMRSLAFERATELFDAMHSYWLSNDYRVLSNHRDLSATALFVENNADAFRMSMMTSVQGELAISATSPCVWPEGTPPPEVARQ
ncbi:MAG: hypothetical protein ACT4NY_32040 [Pseudonocardiales bacterium]